MFDRWQPNRRLYLVHGLFLLPDGFSWLVASVVHRTRRADHPVSCSGECAFLTAPNFLRRRTRIDLRNLYGRSSIATTSIYTHLTEPTRASLRSLLDKVMTDL